MSLLYFSRHSGKKIIFCYKNSPAAVFPATGLLIALCQKLFF